MEHRCEDPLSCVAPCDATDGGESEDRPRAGDRPISRSVDGRGRDDLPQAAFSLHWHAGHAFRQYGRALPDVYDLVAVLGVSGSSAYWRVRQIGDRWRVFGPGAVSEGDACTSMAAAFDRAIALRAGWDRDRREADRQALLRSYEEPMEGQTTIEDALADRTLDELFGKLGRISDSIGAAVGAALAPAARQLIEERVKEEQAAVELGALAGMWTGDAMAEARRRFAACGPSMTLAGAMRSVVRDLKCGDWAP